MVEWRATFSSSAHPTLLLSNPIVISMQDRTKLAKAHASTVNPRDILKRPASQSKFVGGVRTGKPRRLQPGPVPSAKQSKIPTFPELEATIQKISAARRAWEPIWRRNISFASLSTPRPSGGSDDAAAPDFAVASARKEVQAIAAGFPRHLRYSVVETGIYWRMEPDFARAYPRMADKRRKEERWAVMLCSNQDGSHRPPPLCIGRIYPPG